MNLIKRSLEKPYSVRNYYEVASITSEAEPVRLHNNAQVDVVPQHFDDLLHNDSTYDIWINASITICR